MTEIFCRKPDKYFTSSCLTTALHKIISQHACESSDRMLKCTSNLFVNYILLKFVLRKLSTSFNAFIFLSLTSKLDFLYFYSRNIKNLGLSLEFQNFKFPLSINTMLSLMKISNINFLYSQNAIFERVQISFEVSLQIANYNDILNVKYIQHSVVSNLRVEYTQPSPGPVQPTTHCVLHLKFKEEKNLSGFGRRVQS